MSPFLDFLEQAGVPVADTTEWQAGAEITGCHRHPSVAMRAMLWYGAVSVWTEELRDKVVRNEVFTNIHMCNHKYLTGETESVGMRECRTWIYTACL